MRLPSRPCGGRPAPTRAADPRGPTSPDLMETAMDDRSERPSINMSVIPSRASAASECSRSWSSWPSRSRSARWLLFGGLAGGSLVALALVLGRRKHRLGAPRSDLPTSLFSSSLTVDETSSAGDEGRHSDWLNTPCHSLPQLGAVSGLSRHSSRRRDRSAERDHRRSTSDRSGGVLWQPSQSLRRLV